MLKKGQKNTLIQVTTIPRKLESLHEYNACLTDIRFEAGIYFKALWNVYTELYKLLVDKKLEEAVCNLFKKQLSSLSQILQYDDVLSQKLTHIIQIHDLITEAPTVEAKDIGVKTGLLYTKDLLIINRNQLNLIVEELSSIYKKTASSLSSLFAEIETSSEAGYIHTVINEKVIEQTRFDKIEKLLITYSEDLQRLSEIKPAFALSLDQINSIYTVDSERNVLSRVLDLLGKSNNTLAKKSESKQLGAIDLF